MQHLNNTDQQKAELYNKSYNYITINNPKQEKIRVCRKKTNPLNKINQSA
jgi:hypothetical protein